ncbi:unannotated protein [freshwater metagenome]|uniref:Unannotated protein n=1 Tax=freshwater metagenome TaxID=449393 RepID=A0A6J7FAZ8_9ZZZZ|nr:hypothetical protein [Actinomycetota bacterium]
MTSHPTADPTRSATPSSSTRTGRSRTRRIAAASAAAVVLSIGSGAGPLLATASAQSSALEQSLGGATPSTSTGGGIQKVQSTQGRGGGNLNASPDFSGPGISKGVSLIGWAKAACLVIGVLTLTIGIPVSKALKEAGNHHASGIRSGVMGVGGSVLLAGVAGTLLPWLMA